MTRKHFNSIAAAIDASRPSQYDCDRDLLNMQVDIVAKEMALNVGQFNPHFDRQRFLDACGVTS